MTANILLKVDAQIETYIKEVLVTHITSRAIILYFFCVSNISYVPLTENIVH